MYEDILKTIDTLVLLGGIVWALFRFGLERTYKSIVDFTIDCRQVTRIGDNFVVEFVITADNRGHIRHEFPSIKLRVRGIGRDDRVDFWKESRVAFPHKLLDDVEVLFKPKYDYIFVEPGNTQQITYVTALPAKIRLIAARAEFAYKNEDPHSTERVFDLDRLAV